MISLSSPIAADTQSFAALTDWRGVTCCSPRPASERRGGSSTMPQSSAMRRVRTERLRGESSHGLLADWLGDQWNSTWTHHSLAQ